MNNNNKFSEDGKKKFRHIGLLKVFKRLTLSWINKYLKLQTDFIDTQY